MSLQNQNDNYLGNPNIKKDGIVQNWTETEVTEYAKCMKSSVYFVEKYAKIISLDKGLVPFKLYPYQKKMFSKFEKIDLMLYWPVDNQVNQFLLVVIYFGLLYFNLKNQLQY